MAQPTQYDRQYSFSTWQSQHPSDPLPGDQVDAELNAVKATTDEIIANLGEIQNDDGSLANQSVGADQLKPELIIGVAPAVAWAPDTAFSLNQSVFYDLILYRCIEAHTSTSSFDSSKFVELADLTSIVTPDGSITAEKLASGSVTAIKVMDGAITPAKTGGFPGSRILGRFSSSAGGIQSISVGSGLTLNSATGALSASAPPLADGSVVTAKLADGAVTSDKLADGAAAVNLGYTALNKAGDTINGILVRDGHGAHLWHDDVSLASGKITVSTSSPSGGADGDIWFQVDS